MPENPNNKMLSARISEADFQKVEKMVERAKKATGNEDFLKADLIHSMIEYCESDLYSDFFNHCKNRSNT